MKWAWGTGQNKSRREVACQWNERGLLRSIGEHIARHEKKPARNHPCLHAHFLADEASIVQFWVDSGGKLWNKKKCSYRKIGKNYLKDEGPQFPKISGKILFHFFLII